MRQLFDKIKNHRVLFVGLAIVIIVMSAISAMAAMQSINPSTRLADTQETKNLTDDPPKSDQETTSDKEESKDTKSKKTPTTKPKTSTTTPNPTPVPQPAPQLTNTSPGCTSGAFSPGTADPWGGCWPGPQNTGVPSGTKLTNYTESCTITQANKVINAKTVNCVLSIRASGVKITNSQINGGVDVPSIAPSSASFSITDSSVHVGDNLNTGLMRRNFTANRVDITGGRRSVYCMNNCTIQNSWVHAQGGDPAGQAHFSGMRMEQNGVFRHNSITCEATRVPGSGCSAGLTGYGDFAPVRNNLIERNLFYRGGGGGSTMCAYGGSSGDDGSKPYGNQAANIRFIGNRFVLSSTGHCGNLGTIRSFNPSRPGNVWSDNKFNTGKTVNATGP